MWPCANKTLLTKPVNLAQAPQFTDPYWHSGSGDGWRAGSLHKAHGKRKAYPSWMGGAEHRKASHKGKCLPWARALPGPTDKTARVWQYVPKENSRTRGQKWRWSLEYIEYRLKRRATVGWKILELGEEEKHGLFRQVLEKICHDGSYFSWLQLKRQSGTTGIKLAETKGVH